MPNEIQTDYRTALESIFCIWERDKKWHVQESPSLIGQAPAWRRKNNCNLDAGNADTTTDVYIAVGRMNEIEIPKK